MTMNQGPFSNKNITHQLPSKDFSATIARSIVDIQNYFIGGLQHEMENPSSLQLSFSSSVS